MPDLRHFSDAEFPSAPPHSLPYHPHDRPPDYESEERDIHPAAREQLRLLLTNLISKVKKKASPKTPSPISPAVSAFFIPDRKLVEKLRPPSQLPIQFHELSSHSPLEQSRDSSIEKATLKKPPQPNDAIDIKLQVTHATEARDVSRTPIELPAERDEDARTELHGSKDVLCAADTRLARRRVYSAQHSVELSTSQPVPLPMDGCEDVGAQNGVSYESICNTGENKNRSSEHSILANSEVSLSSSVDYRKSCQDTLSEVSPPSSADCRRLSSKLSTERIYIPIAPYIKHQTNFQEDKIECDVREQSMAGNPSKSSALRRRNTSEDHTMQSPRQQVDDRSRPHKEGKFLVVDSMSLCYDSGHQNRQNSSQVPTIPPSSLKLQFCEDVPALTFCEESPVEGEVRTPVGVHEEHQPMPVSERYSFMSFLQQEGSDIDMNPSDIEAILIDAEKYLLPQVLAKFQQLATTFHRSTLQQCLASFDSRHKTVVPSTNYAGTNPSTGSTSLPQSSRPAKSGKQTGRKRKANDEDEEGDRRKQSGEGSRRGTDEGIPTTNDGSHRKLACPFHKRNPGKYRRTSTSGKYKTCPRGFVDPKDLQSHLKMVHCGPKIVCGRCSMQFKTEGNKSAHLKRAVACEPFEDPEFEEEGYIMSEERKKAVEKKAPGVTPEKHWQGIWKILFPDVELPNSIYQDLSYLEAAFDQAVNELAPLYAYQRVAAWPGILGRFEEEQHIRMLLQVLRNRLWGLAERSSLNLNFSGYHGSANADTYGQIVPTAIDEGMELVPFSSDRSTSYLGDSAVDHQESPGFGPSFGGFQDSHDNNLTTMQASIVNLRGNMNDFLADESAANPATNANMILQPNMTSYPTPHLSTTTSNSSGFNGNVPFIEPVIGNSDYVFDESLQQMQTTAPTLTWEAHNIPKHPTSQTNLNPAQWAPVVGPTGLTNLRQQRRPHVMLETQRYHRNVAMGPI